MQTWTQFAAATWPPPDPMARRGSIPCARSWPTPGYSPSSCRHPSSATSCVTVATPSIPFRARTTKTSFYCAGRASLVEDRALRSELGAVFVAERVRSPSPIRGGPPVRVHAWFLSSHPYDGARRSEPRTPGVARRV